MRYAVTIDFYAYADNDADAQKQAEIICNMINTLDDSRAETLSIHEVPYGKIGEFRKVSNCCNEPLIENTDLCSDCKEHTGVDQWN